MSNSRWITQDEVNALPVEPDAAFVALEERARARFDDEMRGLNEHAEGYEFEPLMHSYMSHVLPAAHRYGIAALQHWQRPNRSTDLNRRIAQYREFMDDVDYCVADLKLGAAEAAREQTIALNAAHRQKLRDLLSEAAGVIDLIDVPVLKKDELRRRLNDLQRAVDRELTSLGAYGALAMSVFKAARDEAVQWEPVVGLVERMGRALGIAKDEEERPKLPPPPKQIEDKSGSKKDQAAELDDEIPF